LYHLFVIILFRVFNTAKKVIAVLRSVNIAAPKSTPLMLTMLHIGISCVTTGRRQQPMPILTVWMGAFFSGDTMLARKCLCLIDEAGDGTAAVLCLLIKFNLLLAYFFEI